MNRFKAGLVPLIYGVLVLVGGVIGYQKVQSLPSLISGLVFGIALLTAAFGTWRGFISAHYTAIALTIVLTLFFHYRFVVTQTFMPAGMMAIVSILALIGMFIWRPVSR